MKANLYIRCWLLTLFVGLLISSLTTINLTFGLFFACISGVFSFPFIIIFTVLMKRILQQNPPIMRLHLFTLALHFGGSVLTFIALMIVFDVHRDFNDVLQLAGVIFGYFAVDSIFFHSTIERKYTVSDSKIEDSEILDDLQ